MKKSRAIRNVGRDKIFNCSIKGKSIQSIIMADTCNEKALVIMMSLCSKVMLMFLIFRSRVILFFVQSDNIVCSKLLSSFKLASPNRIKENLKIVFKFIFMRWLKLRRNLVISLILLGLWQSKILLGLSYINFKT